MPEFLVRTNLLSDDPDNKIGRSRPEGILT